jgi:uncharacterized protein
MRSDPIDPRRLDLPRFAEDAAVAAGHWPAPDLARLAEDAPPAGDGLVHWTARGERRAVAGSAPQPWLHLSASTVVRLTCQRCLQALDEPLQAERSFRFVADEAEAERQDEDAEEDVLALPPRGRLDLLPLVEDELILALPLVPRHATCPQPLPLPADDLDEAPAEHPFAALAALKQGKS